MEALLESKDGPAAAPVGMGLVFELGLKNIEIQDKLIENLDTKIGVLMGFLGALIVGMLLGLYTLEPEKIVSILSWFSKTTFLIGTVLIGAGLWAAFRA